MSSQVCSFSPGPHGHSSSLSLSGTSGYKPRPATPPRPPAKALPPVPGSRKPPLPARPVAAPAQQDADQKVRAIAERGAQMQINEFWKEAKEKYSYSTDSFQKPVDIKKFIKKIRQSSPHASTTKVITPSSFRDKLLETKAIDLGDQIAKELSRPGARFNDLESRKLILAAANNGQNEHKQFLATALMLGTTPPLSAEHAIDQVAALYNGVGKKDFAWVCKLASKLS